MVKLDKLAFEYRFVNFRNGAFNGKHVNGSSLLLYIYPVKDHKPVSLSFEPMINALKARGTDICFYESYKISISPENLFMIIRNEQIIHKFCEKYGWDDVLYSIEGYCMDFSDSDQSVLVSELEFKDFLRNNMAGFNAPTNKSARVVSVNSMELILPDSKAENLCCVV